VNEVQIYCHACDGTGYLLAKKWPEHTVIREVCPECDGKKHVNAKGYSDKEEEIGLQ
jgi:DnaJ-class molecular chaperone